MYGVQYTYIYRHIGRVICALFLNSIPIPIPKRFLLLIGVAISVIQSEAGFVLESKSESNLGKGPYRNYFQDL
jgi:hypothetical protein